jgi:hypothetical protein
MFNFNHVSTTSTKNFVGNINAQQQLVCGVTLRLKSKAQDNIQLLDVADVVNKFNNLLSTGHQVDSSRSSSYSVGLLHGNLVISFYKTEKTQNEDRLITSVSLTIAWGEISVEDEILFSTLKYFLKA